MTGTTLPPGVTRVLREGGIVKFGLRLADGAEVESVVVPMRERAPGRQRASLCVSTQVGCRMGCAFCATARMGLGRNLEPEEILAQVSAARSLGAKPTNITFMGMGEPLDNFDRWAASVRLLIDLPAGLAVAMNRMTVSTCGLVPGLDRLAELNWRRVTLAVSLNAPNDAIRSRLMPVNRKHPMAELKEALLRHPLRRGVFMAEYVLLAGINDRPEHADELAEYLAPFRAAVNLIPYNGVKGAEGFEPPARAAVELFQGRLRQAGRHAVVRETKGRGIEAACGQLTGSTARPPSSMV
ncbi:MAG: 23S rRNA (adenine(2503)-C(2))-methyltransferase RlmN [Elusimicrobia bacterium]|nr:23S rRNA (adenine(2503)-C(2))-methyltransferase RlmN [Elusimicrobiota bacterium]